MQWPHAKQTLSASVIIAGLSLVAYADAERTGSVLPTIGSFLFLISPLVCAWAVPNGMGMRLLQGVVALACVGAALAQGANAHGTAFNRCVDSEGTALRTALTVYKATHGAFPESLVELPGEPSCAAPLTGSIVQYRPSTDGYTLWFGSFVTHTATESSDFTAHK